ncbi:MAG: radical SAM protein [Nanoarchaeota archaeon]|nr:radical SAM protein [Nanoarchaeota archaeon]
MKRFNSSKCGEFFYIQWHITEKCNNNCKHCYSRNHRIKKDVSLHDFELILKDIENICKRWGRMAQITLIGGDPMIHPKFKEMVRILGKKRWARLLIAGNPEPLTQEMISFLKQNNVFAYQLSLDGLRNTHDKIRYNGSFNITTKKIKELSESGMRIQVMSTISEKNVTEMIRLMKLAYSLGAHRWAFSRYVPPVGNKLKLSPPAYLSFLKKMEKAHKPYEQKGYPKQIKDPLWTTFRGINTQTDCNDCNAQKDGCGIGTPTLGILPDNTIMACRRHAGSKLGKWNGSNLLHLFLNSPTMNKLRKVEKIRGCKSCKFLYYCRGCRAVAYAVRGNIYDPDPTCILLYNKKAQP